MENFPQTIIVQDLKQKKKISVTGHIYWTLKYLHIIMIMKHVLLVVSIKGPFWSHISPFFKGHNEKNLN